MRILDTFWILPAILSKKHFRFLLKNPECVFAVSN